MSGIKIFTKAIIDAKPWTKDPLALKKKWSEEEYYLSDHGDGQSLCFGMLWDNGIVRPHPPLQRAMEITKAALEAAGHKGKFWDCIVMVLVVLTSCSIVIDWEPYRYLEIYKNAVSFLMIYSEGPRIYRAWTGPGKYFRRR